MSGTLSHLKALDLSCKQETEMNAALILGRSDQLTGKLVVSHRQA
jgi:hypothetical protein